MSKWTIVFGRPVQSDFPCYKKYKKLFAKLIKMTIEKFDADHKTRLPVATGDYILAQRKRIGESERVKGSCWVGYLCDGKYYLSLDDDAENFWEVSEAIVKEYCDLDEIPIGLHDAGSEVTLKVPCDCPCHRGMPMLHFVPCCDGGFVMKAIASAEEKKPDDFKYPIGGYAPGNYQCKCVTCGKNFIGDKRAVECLLCAIETITEKPTYGQLYAQLFRAKERIRELETALRKIAEMRLSDHETDHVYALDRCNYIASKALKQ